MKPDHKKLLYEGKAKRIYSTEFDDRVLVEFKDDTTAFNAKKRQQIEDKGALNCQISAHIFEILEKKGVLTHYLGVVSKNLFIADFVKVIPLEIVVRNIASGSLCRETPIAPGTNLFPPLLDLYYKDDNLSDPLLTDARLEILGLVSKERRLEIDTIAMNVNNVLKPFFADLNLLLVDFKLELGINNAGELVVADEISPDTCRLWDQLKSDPNERILDKDRFRKDLGGLAEAYREILKRVQSVCSKPRNYR